MKTSNASRHKAGLVATGLILLSVVFGMSAAGAQAFRNGGSMAIIEQSGGGTSRSEVIRYQDGQKIVTRDGGSTDITIQGSAARNGYRRLNVYRFKNPLEGFLAVIQKIHEQPLGGPSRRKINVTL